MRWATITAGAVLLAVLASLTLPHPAGAATKPRFEGLYALGENLARRPEPRKIAGWESFGNLTHQDCIYAAIGNWELAHGYSPREGEVIEASQRAGATFPAATQRWMLHPIGHVEAILAPTEGIRAGTILGLKVGPKTPALMLNAATVGGHAVYVARVDSTGPVVISWGYEYQLTDAEVQGDEEVYEVTNVERIE